MAIERNALTRRPSFVWRWLRDRPPYRPLTGVMPAQSSTMTDLDSNGTTDLLQRSSRGVSVRYGQPGGGLGPQHVIWRHAATHARILVGDVTGDGRPDVVLLDPDTARTTRTDVRVLAWTKIGTYTQTGPVSHITGWPSDAVLIDLDADGRADLVYQHVTDQPHDTQLDLVAWSNGNGTFG
jgi:hypothetical protein